jgi:hypothetical protein
MAKESDDGNGRSEEESAETEGTETPDSGTDDVWKAVAEQVKELIDGKNSDGDEEEELGEFDPITLVEEAGLKGGRRFGGGPIKGKAFRG